MAIYRANTNGSWTASSPYIWDIYDEQTDTWGSASSYPNSTMDDAYLNGFDVTSNNIYLKSLHNDANLDLGINAGGQLLVSGNVATFTSDIFGSDIIRFTTNTSSNTIYVNGNLKLSGALFLGNIIGLNTPIVITGNVDMSDSHTYLYKSRGASLTIIGNIILPQYYLYERNTANTGTLTITINGNVTATTLSLGIANNNSGDITINGICNFLNSPSIFSTTTASVNVYGKLFTDHNLTVNNLYATEIKSYDATISCNSLTINGTISYTSNNNSIGVKYNTINILNPDTFTWKDISEPRSNPFIILTDAEMSNRQQYPPENEVKEGTEYVWGEKVGTYQQPPESVVLKDYVYDNGERTGTLENEVTINVGCTNPQDVRKDIPLANMGTVGTMVIPSRENVLEGTIYDNGTEGTLESQSTADYPAEDKVLIGTSYDHDSKTGALEPGGDNPQESDVRFGVPYNHNLNIGKAHIPSSQDVRKNVPVEDTVGQIVIPRASEVKKDVEFDIDSVGTLESTVQTNNTINVYRKR